MLTAAELCGLLNLDKSTMSRIITQLIEEKLVSGSSKGGDRRSKPLALTEAGRRKLKRIHAYAEEQVIGALDLLTPKEREAVALGLNLYAKALGRWRAQQEFRIRPIEPRDNPEVARLIRRVMPEFGANGPGFAIQDPEVDDMAHAYRQPRAAYCVLLHGERIVGGAGFAMLAGASGDICELRKMYFLPEARGVGMGRKLLLHILEAARTAGYATCYLETLTSMTQAQRLYAACGFKRMRQPMGNTGHFGCDRWYTKSLVS
jgi:putative acetyltransferase